MTDDELIQLERSGWEALATSGEAARSFFRERLADDVLFVLPGGMVIDDRAAAVDSMSGQPWERFELHDARVVRLADNAAVVTYRVEASRDGAEYEALVSSSYVRNGEAGEWMLVHHQQTPL